MFFFFDIRFLKFTKVNLLKISKKEKNNTFKTMEL